MSRARDGAPFGGWRRSGSTRVYPRHILAGHYMMGLVSALLASCVADPPATRQA